MSSFTYGSASVSISGGAVTLSVSDTNLEFNLDWSYERKKWPHLKSDGSVDVKFQDIDLTIGLAVVNSNGRPGLVAKNVDMNLDKIKVDFHGTWLEWLYKLILGIFKGKLKDGIATVVETDITNLVNVVANQALSTMDLEPKVSEYLQLDMHLIDNPTFMSGFFWAGFKGMFESIKSPVDAPVAHVNIPNTKPTKMFQFSIDQYVANSALWNVQNLGLLDFTITNSMIPPTVPFHLTTDSFKGVFPALFEKYGSADIEWDIDPRAVPTVTIDPKKKILLTTGFGQAWNVITKDGKSEALKLDMTLYFGIDLNVDGDSPAIHGSVTTLVFDISVENTNIGPVNVTPLNGLFNSLFGGIIKGMVDGALKTGLPLPVVKGISLTNTELILNEGYVTLESDIKYTVPTEITDAVRSYKSVGMAAPSA